MKSNLAISNLSLTNSANSKLRRPAPSVAQNTQTSTIQMLGQIWRSLSFSEKGTFVAAAQQINGSMPVSLTKSSKLTPYLTFIQTGTALYTTQGSVPRTATTPVVYPAQFSNVTLGALGSGQNFALNLLTPGGFPDSVILRCAPPVPSGYSRFAKKSFKVIGSLPNLTAQTNITDLFLAHYHNPGPGATIALEIVGVSPSGLRTAPLLLTVVTTSPSADTPALTIE